MNVMLDCPAYMQKLEKHSNLSSLFSFYLTFLTSYQLCSMFSFISSCSRATYGMGALLKGGSILSPLGKHKLKINTCPYTIVRNVPKVQWSCTGSPSSAVPLPYSAPFLL